MFIFSHLADAFIQSNLQVGTIEAKCESDFVPLWDGTIMHRSLAERKLLEAHKSEVVNLGKGAEPVLVL